MGKRVKAKGRNPRKPRSRDPNPNPDTNREPDESNENEDKTESEKSSEKSAQNCNHYTRDSSYLNQTLLSILCSKEGTLSCEHCRDQPTKARKSSNSNNNNKSKKKVKGGLKGTGSKYDPDPIWVCLDCGRCFCGGAVDAAVPYGHARRHAKQDRHNWFVGPASAGTAWCFACNSEVPIDMPSFVEDSPPTATGSKPESESKLETELESKTGGTHYLIRGLANLGNTCFFNSVLQNLLALKTLREHITNPNPNPAQTDSSGVTGPLTSSIKKLFLETSSTDLLEDSRNGGTISPKNLFGSICSRAPQFRGYQQQDSHELLRYLLDGLHTEEISARKLNHGSAVDRVFGGQLSSAVCCSECGYTSVVHEPFLDLSLPVPGKSTGPVSRKGGREKPLVRARSGRSQRLRERGTTRGVVLEEEAIEGKMERTGGGSPESSVLEVGEADGSSELSTASAEPEKGSTVIEATSDAAHTESAGADVVPAELVNADVALEGSSWMDYVGTANETWVLEASSVTSNADVAPGGAVSKTKLCEDSETSRADVMPDGGVSEGKLSEDTETSRADMVLEGAVSEAKLSEDSEISRADVVPAGMVSGTKLSEDSETSRADVVLEGVVCGAMLPKDFETSRTVTVPEGTVFDASLQFEDFENLRADVVPGGDSCWLDYLEPATDTTNTELALSNLESQACVGDSIVDILVTRNIKSSGEQTGENSVENTSSPTNTDVILLPYKEINEPSLERETREEGDFDGFGDLFNEPEEANSGPKPDRSRSVPNGEEDDDMVFWGSSYSTIHNNTDYFTTGEEVDGSSDSPVSVSTCLNLFMKPELLTNEHAWHCERCSSSGSSSGSSSSSSNGEVECNGEDKKKVMRDAVKRFLISRLPRVLTVHLKRFSQDARGRLSKLRGRVEFDESLDLKPYIDPRSKDDASTKYRLVGLIEHSGSMGGGHYLAYVRGERILKSGSHCPTWFYCSDAHVRQVSLNEVLKSEAYILFYERVEE